MYEMANRECLENCKSGDLPLPEKPNDDEVKSRRSSILKPKKPRNPLGDLDLGNDETQDDDTTTLSRTTTSRRVSFAPNNFVKQFVQDPEKNTIWDSTYEESLEKSSDPSPNSCVPNVVLLHTSVLLEEGMDITLGKENAQILSLSNKSTENKENLVNNIELTLLTNETLQSINETTCCNASIVTDIRLVDNRNLPDINNEVTQMEFTEVLPIYQKNLIDENMQMGCTQVVMNNASSLNNRTVYFDTSIQNDTNIVETAPTNDHMELTEVMKLVNSNETGLNQNCFTSTNSCALNVVKVNNDSRKMNISDNITVQNGSSNTENLNIFEVTKSVNLSTNCQASVTSKNHKILPESCVSNNEILTVKSSEHLACADTSKPGKNTTHTTLSSFHASLSELPSCDDTQHLINYNLSLKNQPKSDFSKIIENEYNPTFLNSKYLPLDINSESFRVSINTIDSCSKHIDAETKSIENTAELLLMNNGSVIDLVTFTSILEKDALENNETVISQTDISLASLSTDKDENSSVNSFLISLQDELITPQLNNQEYENIVERVKKNLAYGKRVWRIIEKKFDEFQAQFVKMNQRGREDSWESDSSSDSIIAEHCSRRLSFLNFLQHKEPDEILTLREKVKQLCERYNSYWKITSLEDGVYKFDALCETVNLTVKLNETNGEVVHTEIEEDTLKKHEPIILYLRKVFVDKLSPSSMCSALGEKFNVLSFLDYLEITVQKIANMKNDFDKLIRTYAITVDSDFSVKFTIVSIKLEQIWEFYFNIHDLKDISIDTVNVNVKMGHLSKSNIRKCLKGCPKGFEFISVFIQNVYSMLQSLEQKI